MADFGGGDLDAFRGEVRAWLADNYPAELKDPKAKTDPEAMWGGRAFEGSNDPHIKWMRKVAEKGWTAPAWPNCCPTSGQVESPRWWCGGSIDSAGLPRG